MRVFSTALIAMVSLAQAQAEEPTESKKPGIICGYSIKGHCLASEISSRQRCACTWHGPTRITHHRRYRSVRTAYLTIGYDPLPYRFGSTSVCAPPYRYYW
jgi:hypothetical protein